MTKFILLFLISFSAVAQQAQQPQQVQLVKPKEVDLGLPTVDCNGNLNFNHGLMGTLDLGKAVLKSTTLPEIKGPQKIAVNLTKIDVSGDKVYLLKLTDPGSGALLAEMKGRMNGGLLQGELKKGPLTAQANIDLVMGKIDEKVMTDIFTLFKGETGTLELSVGNTTLLHQNGWQTKFTSTANGGVVAKFKFSQDHGISIRAIGGPGVNFTGGKGVSPTGTGMLILELF